MTIPLVFIRQDAYGSRRRSVYELTVYVVIILAYCNLYQINYQDLPLCLYSCHDVYGRVVAQAYE